MPIQPIAAYNHQVNISTSNVNSINRFNLPFNNIQNTTSVITSGIITATQSLPESLISFDDKFGKKLFKRTAQPNDFSQNKTSKETKRQQLIKVRNCIRLLKDAKRIAREMRVNERNGVKSANFQTNLNTLQETAKVAAGLCASLGITLLTQSVTTAKEAFSLAKYNLNIVNYTHHKNMLIDEAKEQIDAYNNVIEQLNKSVNMTENEKFQKIAANFEEGNINKNLTTGLATCEQNQGKFENISQNEYVDNMQLQFKMYFLCEQMEMRFEALVKHLSQTVNP